MTGVAANPESGRSICHMANYYNLIIGASGETAATK
jgi:hypothetical protein